MKRKVRPEEGASGRARTVYRRETARGMDFIGDLQAAFSAFCITVKILWKKIEDFMKMLLNL